MATLTLLPHEVESPVWKKVQTYLEDSLRENRESNDVLSQTPESTAAIRGRIKFLKETLDAAKKANRPGLNAPASI